MRHLRLEGNRDGVAVGSSFKRFTRACGVGLLIALGSLAFTGCTSPLGEPFCGEFESAWNDFAAVRDGTNATPEMVIAASETFRDRLNALYDNSDAPEDVRTMVGITTEDFTSAWSATTRSDRQAYHQSWTNGRDYIALQCSEIGITLTFDGSEVPLETPRLSHGDEK